MSLIDIFSNIPETVVMVMFLIGLLNIVAMLLDGNNLWDEDGILDYMLETLCVWFAVIAFFLSFVYVIGRLL